MKFRFIGGAFSLLLLCLSLHAQLGLGEGRLKGVVSDEAGKPVAGAQVVILNTVYSVSMNTTTDAKGRWAFSGLASAWYKITVKKEGYLDAITEFQLSLVGQRVQTLDVTLKKPRAEDGQAVAATANAASASLVQAGNDLYNQQKFAEALVKYEEFRKANPKVYQVEINIGNCHLALKDPDQALAAFTRFLEAAKADKGTLAGDESAAKVLAAIGKIYLDRADVVKAKDFFKQAIDAYPGDAVLPYNLGELLFNEGQADQAIDYLLVAVKIDGKWAPPYLKLGYAYLNKGLYTKAAESLKTFLELAPDDPQAAAVKELLPNVEKLAKGEKK